MDRPTVREDISALYLRLNGYFLAHAFLAHREGPQGLRSEIDLLAVRFPLNSEPERQIGPSGYLQVSNEVIDFLICEVKGGNNALSFNSSVRLPGNRTTVETLLRWMGAFPENAVPFWAEKVQELMNTENNDPSTFPCARTCLGVQIRTIIFAPDRRPPRGRVRRFVHGDVLINYIWDCFRPDTPRRSCATEYYVRSWARYDHIVRVFKDSRRTAPPSMQEIYEACGVPGGD
jgi:hypothetical protein